MIGNRHLNRKSEPTFQIPIVDVPGYSSRLSNRHLFRLPIIEPEYPVKPCANGGFKGGVPLKRLNFLLVYKMEEYIADLLADVTEGLEEHGEASVGIDANDFSNGGFIEACMYALERLAEEYGDDRYDRYFMTHCMNWDDDLHFCDACDWAEFTIVESEVE